MGHQVLEEYNSCLQHKGQS